MEEGVLHLYCFFSTGGSTVPLIHKVKPLMTGEPSVLLSIMNFYFCMDRDWSEPSPLQRIPHFRIFSFALKGGLLEAGKGSVSTAVPCYPLWIAHLRAHHLILVAHKHFAGTLLLSSRHTDVFTGQLQVGMEKWNHSNSILDNLFFICVLEQLMIKQNCYWEKNQ